MIFQSRAFLKKQSCQNSILSDLTKIKNIKNYNYKLKISIKTHPDKLSIDIIVRVV